MSGINFKFKISNLKFQQGFTLVEFMVAMTLVAILSGIAMANFIGTQKRGRDVRRQSDLNQFRIALENYASVNGGIYPKDTYNGTSSAGTGVFNSSGGPLVAFVTGFPADPQGKAYYYVADTGGTTYVLESCMESTNKAFQSCSIGKAGITNNACATAINQVDSTCDLP